MLDGFFFIESWRMESEDLFVRLVPDHYEVRVSEPVVVVVVNRPETPQALDAALAQRKDDRIVDLQVTDDAVTLYAEFDDEPACLRGGAVSVSRGPYSVADLQRIIGYKDDELSRNYETLRLYQATIDGTRNLVSELIRRAEAKREATTRDQERYKHEVDVLRRILHRIQER